MLLAMTQWVTRLWPLLINNFGWKFMIDGEKGSNTLFTLGFFGTFEQPKEGWCQQ